MIQVAGLRSINAVVVGFIAALGFAAGSAHAQTINSAFSGTFSSSHIDSNSDGMNAAVQNVRIVTSPMGPSVIEALNEFAMAGPGTCRNGAAGLRFTQVISATAPASGVQRFERNGDLLYLTLTAGTACLDLLSRTLFTEASGRITGGTGTLAGATGTFRLTGEGSFLYFTPTDAFGGVRGTIDATLVLP
jgi:hypothetical protein